MNHMIDEMREKPSIEDMHTLSFIKQATSVCVWVASITGYTVALSLMKVNYRCDNNLEIGHDTSLH